MAKKVKKKWVRLKRFIQKLKIVDPNVGTGDGGLMTEDFLNRNNTNKTDSTFVVKDSVVVAHPKN
jgi:hypothetical protein